MNNVWLNSFVFETKLVVRPFSVLGNFDAPWAVWVASIISLCERRSYKIVLDRPGLQPIPQIEHGQSK